MKFHSFVNNFGISFLHPCQIFQVAFKLSDALANKEDGNINKKEEKDNNKKDDKDAITSDVKDKVKVPREYKMVLSKVEQSMGMFSERTAGCITCVAQSILICYTPNSDTFTDLTRMCPVIDQNSLTPQNSLTSLGKQNSLTP